MGELGDLPVQIVVLLGREKHKESHLILFLLLELLENVIKVDTLDEAVAFGDSKHCPLESDFICSIDHPCLEAHLCDVLHKEVAEFIDSTLGVREESSAKLGLSTFDDG